MSADTLNMVQKQPEVSLTLQTCRDKLDELTAGLNGIQLAGFVSILLRPLARCNVDIRLPIESQITEVVIEGLEIKAHRQLRGQSYG